MATIKERWRAFRQWQQRPYEVAPLRNESHTCSTCGTQFEGNYCPRCGQSGRVGRYSFKNMLKLFLDVWGLGNRSMFRSLRDLILRPGYMIRDYLKGMQMAYFPPFKMFFLLTTFSIIISSGLNLKGENKLKQEDRHVEIAIEEDAHDDTSAESKVTNNALSDNSQREQERMAAIKAKLKGYSDAIFNFGEKFPNIFSLFGLVLLSGFLYIFFRRCPAIPDLRYSEFLVALVYTSNMYTMYCMALDFLCIDYGLLTLALALTMVPLKQLSGFKWWRLIFNIIMASILMAVALFVVLAAAYLVLTHVVLRQYYM